MTTLAIRPFSVRDHVASAVWLVPPVIAAAVAGLGLDPWLAMVGISFSIYGFFKWLSWTGTPTVGRDWDRPSAWRYMLLWPGMDPAPFRSPAESVARPAAVEWLGAVAKAALGVLLVWSVAGRTPVDNVFARGWIVLLGLGLTLHCGLFHVLALAWRAKDVPVNPIMNAPSLAHSPTDFWGRRWNLAFRDLAHRFVFRPCLARFGPAGASRMAFLFSGLVHELAISVPAQGGYGMPLLYFLIQAIAVETERSILGRRLGLRRGWRGRSYAALVVVGPAGLLFHRPWFENVVLPMAHAIGAI